MKFTSLRLVLQLFLISVALRLTSQDRTVTYYQDPSSVPPDLIVDLKHVNANVKFEPALHLISGDVVLTVVPKRYLTDSIIFYTPGFRIISAGIRLPEDEKNGRKWQEYPLRYKLSGSNLVIFLFPEELSGIRMIRGNEYQIRIVYEAVPENGPIYFIGWKPEEKGKRKEIWAHRPHNWLPYLDARVTTDMFITFDSRFRVFANGERLGITENGDDTKTWHYAMKKDHPYFSTSLVIGDYDYASSVTSSGIPLEYWYYSGMADRVPVTYKYTERMFDFLEKEIGVKYPYPVYREAPVIDYMYGGMETTTATVFGDYMLIDPHAWWQRNYVNVNAHELAHQWFGDCIAHLVNKDVWLTESFGTYYAKMFERSVYGEEYYENIRNDEMNQAFDAAKKNDYPVGGSQGGVQRIYQKGSLVLDMLRDVMGEKEFRDAVKLYTERFSFKYAQTCDFIRAVYDATGRSYQWFFDEWILHGGEPNFKVEYQKKTDSTGSSFTEISITQIQEINELKPVFRMPLKFEVHYADGSCDSLSCWIDKKEQFVRIPDVKHRELEFLLVDPGRRILKKMSFERSFKELSSQLLNSRNMIDRYDALLALSGIPVDTKRKLLITSFEREKFHLIPCKILEQLSRDRDTSATGIFRKALHHADANVRKSALLFLDTIPPALKTDAEACLKDSSYMNIEYALGRLCSSFPSETGRYLEMTKDMEGWRGMNIRIKWLELAVGNGKYEFLKELIQYSGPGYEFETRMNSLSALQRLNYNDPAVTENARNAASHWNFKLAAVGKAYLSNFKINP